MFHLVGSILLSLVALGLAQSDCPDLCQPDRCPRFLTADCDMSPDCEPMFTWRGRDVSTRCPVRTCVDLESRCDRDNRMCVERTIPPTCPEGSPKCRQYLRARCEYVPTDFPDSCDDIMCGEGMECRFREREGGFRPVVRCVPRVIDSCEELTCATGEVCELRGVSRPVCVTPPPPTTQPPTTQPPSFLPALSCEELTCPQGSECALRSVPSRGLEFAFCFSSDVIDLLQQPTCATTTCPEGELCWDITTANDIQILPVCLNTEDLICETQADCMDGFECTPPQSPMYSSLCTETHFFVVFTNQSCLESGRICPNDLECRNTYFGDQIAYTSCSERTGLDDFAQSCDGLVCSGEDTGCIADSYPERDYSLASCVINFEAQVSGIEFVVEQLMNNTLSMSLALTCEELTCPPDHGCLLNRIPSTETQLAQCAPSDVVAGIQTIFDSFFDRPVITCQELPCPNGTICVDLQSGEQYVTPACIIANCESDMECGDEEMCVSDTESVLGSVTSVCGPDSTVVGSDTCAASLKDCGSLQCQEVYFNGTIIAQICSLPAPSGLIGMSCDELTCMGEDVGCIEQEIPGVQIAACTPNFSATVAGLMQLLAMAGLN